MKKSPSPKKILFGKRNYGILFISFIIISSGFIIMAGGGSKDPNYFNEEIFNFTRIRIAPTLILVGFGVAIYSILTKTKNFK